MNNTQFPAEKEADWNNPEYFMEDFRAADGYIDCDMGSAMLKLLEESLALLSKFDVYEEPQKLLEKIGYKAKPEKRDPNPYGADGLYWPT